MSTGARDHTLDAGFWRATIVMGVISVLGMWGVVVFPIEKFLPAVAVVSHEIDWLFRFMAFFSVPILVYVNGYIIYFALRYRNRRNVPVSATGSPIHDHPKLEFWWTALPSVLMIALAILSYPVIPHYYSAAASGTTNSVTMEAIGYQWGYEFRYPGLPLPVMDEMHVPVNVEVTLEVTSKDVIHSFWMPELRLKQDMVPGMVIPIQFKPTQTGNYRIICTEFCGLGHSDMRTGGRGSHSPKLIVESQADFDAWYADEKGRQAKAAREVVTAAVLAAGDAAAGSQLFPAKCAVCHNAASFEQRKVGPGIGNLFHDARHPDLVDGKPATPMNVAEILEKGFRGDMGVMPDQQTNGLSAKDIADLVAYLKTLNAK